MTRSGDLDWREIAPWLDAIVDLSAAQPAFEQGAPSFERLVDEYRRLALEPGSLVALSLPSGAAALRHFSAVLAAQCVPVLVAPALPAARLRELLHQLGASAVVAPRLDASAVPQAEHTLLAGAECLRFAFGPTATRAGEAVLLTSGTSGFASGCVFAFDGLLENARRHAEAIDLQPADVMFITLPVYFSYALVAQFLAALVVGCRVIISGPPFHAASYLRHAAQYRASVSALTPLVARNLLAQRASWPESLHKLSIGGDQLAAQQVGELLAARPRRELYLTYGLTEAGPRVATLAAHCAPQHQWASVGQPLRETHVHLEPVEGTGGDRQLLVESATVMDRRIGLVDSKRDTLRRPGLIATGDIFTRDDDGCLYFQRRMGDFLLRQGEKLCLASVRRIAASMPGVLAARTQVVHDGGDAEYELFLTLANSAPTTRTTVEQRLRSLLRRNELPRQLHWLSAAETAGHK